MNNDTNVSSSLENKDENTLDKIVEDATAGEGSGDDSKQEVEKSPYEMELERLKAENAKKDELLLHKNRAISALKAEVKEIKTTPKVDEVPANADDELVYINGVAYTKTQVEAIKSIGREETEQLRKELSDKDKELMLNQLVVDPKERELVKFHLENTLKGSNANLAENIANARLLANRNLLLNPEEEKENMREELIASFSAGTVSGSKHVSQHSSPANKQAAEILRSAGLGHIADKYIKN